MFSNKKENYCPLLKKECIKHDCAWFVTVRGYDLNTGKDVDNQQCVISTIPMLLIENSGQQRGTGAAVESLRNEMINRADTTNQILTNVILQASVSQLPSASATVYELPESN
jgi:hypothetical protein